MHPVFESEYNTKHQVQLEPSNYERPEQMTNATPAKIISTEVFEFDALSDKAKEKARDWFRANQDGAFEWENLTDDAENVGLNIISLRDRYPGEGSFTNNAQTCAVKILAEHGENCATYKAADNFLQEYNTPCLSGSYP